MPEASLREFAPEPLNPIRIHTDEAEQPAVEGKQGDAASLERFAQDVEEVVRAKVNQTPFRANRRYKLPRIKVSEITNPDRRAPLTVARHFCCYILANHPHSKGAITPYDLAERYKRDRSTIYNGLRRAAALISSCHDVVHFIQDGIDQLGDEYGAYSLWEAAGVSPERVVATRPSAKELRNRLKRPPPRKTPTQLARRNQAMYKLLRAGIGTKDLSERYSLSQNRVQKIVKAQSLENRIGGEG